MHKDKVTQIGNGDKPLFVPEFQFLMKRDWQVIMSEIPGGFSGAMTCTKLYQEKSWKPPLDYRNFFLKFPVELL